MANSTFPGHAQAHRNVREAWWKTHQGLSYLIPLYLATLTAATLQCWSRRRHRLYLLPESASGIRSLKPVAQSRCLPCGSSMLMLRMSAGMLIGNNWNILCTVSGFWPPATLTHHNHKHKQMNTRTPGVRKCVCVRAMWFDGVEPSPQLTDVV